MRTISNESFEYWVRKQKQDNLLKHKSKVMLEELIFRANVKKENHSIAALRQILERALKGK